MPLWLLLLHAGLTAAAEPDWQEIVYMHYGGLQDYQALGALHALRSNPKAHVTVILDNNQGSDVAAWKQLAANTQLNIYVPMDFTVVEKFKSVYRHASINKLEKEVFCIYRHLLLHQYMMENNITSLVYLDLDIVVFNNNLFKLLPEDSAISPIGTFAIHWTQNSLTAFSRYIWHFYERDPLEIAQHVAMIGRAGPELDDHLADNELIDEWWPDAVPRHHISDMRLFKNFVQTTGALHILCNGNKVGETCPKALHLVRNAKQHPIIHAINFDQHALAVQQFRDAFDWVKHSEYNYTLPVMTDVRHGRSAVPGMHFQGHCKRVMPEILCPNLVSYFPNNVVLMRICTPDVLTASVT